MANLKDTIVTGRVSQTQAASSAYDLVRLVEFEAELAAFESAYAHAPATVADSATLDLTITGQQISGAVRLLDGGGLLADAGGLTVVYGTAEGTAARGDHSHALADGSSYGFLSAPDYAKLQAIEPEATANEPDEFLLDRGNHSGTQGWETIEDFEAGVGVYALPLAGGTITGLVSFSGDGALQLAEIDDAGEALLEPVARMIWFNPDLGLPRYYDGLTINSLGAPTDEVDLTSVYGDLTISEAHRATLANGVVTVEKLADTASGLFLVGPESGVGPPRFVAASVARGLLNVADGATANATNAFLVSRANHTGTQYASSIYDFAEAVAAIALGPEGGEIAGPVTFTGSTSYFRLPRLTTTEIEALTFTASDKGVLVYNVTTNRAEIVTPSGRVALLVGGEGGDFLLVDGSAASTGRRQEFKTVNLTDPTEITISSDSLTVTQGFHRVDTEGNAALDSIYNIYGMATGDETWFLPENAARDFVFHHGVGNVRCAGGSDLTVDASASEFARAIYDHAGLVWVAKFGVDATGGGGGDTLPVTDTTALVKDPADATKRVRLDAGLVATGQTRVLQAPDGDAKAALFTVERVVGSSGPLSLEATHVMVLPRPMTLLDVHAEGVAAGGGTALCYITKNGSHVGPAIALDQLSGGLGGRPWGVSTQNVSFAAGDRLGFDITDTGAGGYSEVTGPLQVSFTGFWHAT